MKNIIILCAPINDRFTIHTYYSSGEHLAWHMIVRKTIRGIMNNIKKLINTHNILEPEWNNHVVIGAIGCIRESEG